MKAAIQKYGRDSFSKDVLCIGTKDYILNLEEKMILAYDTTTTGYNICKGGKDYPSGHSIPNASMTEPVYISGFWFPLREVAIKALDIKLGKYYKWKREDCLGNCIKNFKVPPSRAVPVFVKGFWFPTRDVASKALGIPPSTVYRQSKENPYGLYFKEGSQKGAKSPSAKAVIIDGVIYGSTKEAARETGIMSETIRRRIKNQQEGYAYATSE